MRSLARQLGVTHQKVGRWLREGEPGGIKAIPAAASQAIGKVFTHHVKLAKEVATAQGLPFRAALPIYTERRALDTGNLGDRVFSENTQFIKRATLDKIVKQAHKSQKFAHVSARSVVDIHSYAKAAALGQIAERKAKGRSTPYSANALAKIIANKIDEKDSKRVISSVKLQPLFTQYTPIYPGSDLPAALDEFDSKLRTKHEPATGAPGTALADQLLFQLMPRSVKRVATRPAKNVNAKTQQGGARSTRTRKKR